MKSVPSSAITRFVSFLGIFRKSFIYAFLFLLVCNIQPVTGILTAFLVDVKGIQFGFVTKDLHFFAPGDWTRIKKSENYTEYRKRYPNADHTLYRVNRSKDYSMFWRYLEYATNPNWRAPFIKLPADFIDVPYYGDSMDSNPRYVWNPEKDGWRKVR